MRLTADFHIHSRFSRATSTDMGIRELSEGAVVKGIDIVGTGDFTHPKWLAELRSSLQPAENGLFMHGKTLFVLSAEVSNVFEEKRAMKKVHTVILAPSFDVVEQINDALSKHGELDADGRPTLDMPCSELSEIINSICRDCLLIPAHAWTPWFSVFGSRSGFNSIEECFEDQSKNIYAIETGLSSDPAMNWRVSSLDKYALVSNSDAHSPHNIGREANVFEIKKPSYYEIIDAIKKKDERFVMTIEFFPEKGKYHYDGHRNCNVSLHPRETIKYKNICPVCRKPLTLGVLHRVEELADREEGFMPKNAKPYMSVLPLEELIAKALGTTPSSKKSRSIYNLLIERFGNELGVFSARSGDIYEICPELAPIMDAVKSRTIRIKPGYDGVYGEVELKPASDRANQKTLGEFFV
ncbi:MAG: endonuclease Q family protein [Candidatus Micrarchaeia archaeon]